MDKCIEELQISKEIIIRIVENKLNSSPIELLDYKLEPIENCNGFLALHNILNIRIKFKGNNKNIEFFVKQFPIEESVIEFAEQTGAFKKEIFIYNLFERIQNEGISFLSNSIPYCYFSEADRILIFNNLKDEGYIEMNKTKPLDYDNVIKVIESLAKLHASSIIFEEELSTTNHPYRLINEYQNYLDESFFKETQHFVISSSINGVLGLADIFDFPELLSSGKNFKIQIEILCNKIYQYVKPSIKHRNVITHGDLWCTNFLMKYDKNNKAKNCKLVDFQYARYTPPAQDVLALLYLTTTREFRKQFMYEILGTYYATLEKLLKLFNYNLKDIIPFDVFMETCEDQKAFGIVQTSFHLPMVLVPSDLIKNYFQDRELYRKAFCEDRTHLIRAYFDQDEDYRTRLYDLMLDLKDYCELV